MSKTKRKSKKQKKIILIVVGALVALALIGTALSVLMAPKTPTAVINSDIPIADAPELGACQLVTTDAVKKATFGQKISSITEGVRVGTKGYEGQDADACGYAFSTDKSTDNLLTVAVYNSFVTTKEAKNQSQTVWTEVSGTDPRVYFIDGTVDDGEVTIYTLRQSVGGNTVLYTIRQPKNEGAFLRAEAIWFLSDIAKSANTTVVETKNTEQAEKAVEGGIPLAPPATTVQEVNR